MTGKALIGKLAAGLALTSAFAALATQPALAFDGRSVDTRSVAEAQGYWFDARSPDARATPQQPSGNWRASEEIDAASRMAPQSASASLAIAVDGFSWNDFGIGVAAALGAMLLLGLALAARRARAATI